MRVEFFYLNSRIRLSGEGEGGTATAV